MIIGLHEKKTYAIKNLGNKAKKTNFRLVNNGLIPDWDLSPISENSNSFNGKEFPVGICETVGGVPHIGITSKPYRKTK